MLGWVQFGRIGGQGQQVDMLRHAQLEAGVSTGTVEDEHDLLVQACAGLLCERCQLSLKEGNVDAGGRMDKANGVAPLEPMLHRRRGGARQQSTSLCAGSA
jgi:hypothetical protein